MNSLSAIILAAGKGTRMRSDLPKVAHHVAGRAMVEWVARSCAEAGCGRIVLVVGYQQEVIREIFRDVASQEWARGVRFDFAEQAEQLGTGHAVQCAAGLFASERSSAGNTVFVLAGDGPLIRAQTLRRLANTHREAKASATLATSVIDDPMGYGRIDRDGSGRFLGIVEHKNCTPAQLAIREVNPSYYCFDAQALFGALAGLKQDSLSGEYFLTDVPAILMKGGARVEVIDAVPPQDVLSINTPEQLAEVSEILLGRSAALRTSGGGT